MGRAFGNIGRRARMNIGGRAGISSGERNIGSTSKTSLALPEFF
ncbi:hypothetical protein [Virgibacillus oceani]|uniref:Uncharacterized protein n=1 Tax=Virgibacillus oceani TaxID=1479511 RepID=A0A917H9Y2_9BACI|nr:hypothetical protein [Virgibacillus oceani]GGG72785.1 hypothetical protein GCM10011398_16460 [Virgibacillus oceani]